MELWTVDKNPSWLMPPLTHHLTCAAQQGINQLHLWIQHRTTQNNFSWYQLENQLRKLFVPCLFLDIKKFLVGNTRMFATYFFCFGVIWPLQRNTRQQPRDLGQPYLVSAQDASDHGCDQRQAFLFAEFQKAGSQVDSCRNLCLGSQWSCGLFTEV